MVSVKGNAFWKWSRERGTRPRKGFWEGERFPEMVSGKGNGRKPSAGSGLAFGKGFWEGERFPEKVSGKGNAFQKWSVGRGTPPGNGFREGERLETLCRLRTTLRSLERGTKVSGNRNTFQKRFPGRGTLSGNGLWKEERFLEKVSGKNTFRK